MSKNPKTTAVILAGGQGRRLGYRDKGMMTWRDKPLIEWMINNLQPQVDQIIISCHQQHAAYQQLGFELCIDQTPDHQGPLAGIKAATPLIQYTQTIICPCDMPLLPADIVAILQQALSKDEIDLVYPVSNHRDYYLPVLIRSTKLEGLDNYFDEGGRSMKGWFSKLSGSTLAFDDHSAFRNCNELADFS